MKIKPIDVNLAIKLHGEMKSLLQILPDAGHNSKRIRNLIIVRWIHGKLPSKKTVEKWISNGTALPLSDGYRSWAAIRKLALLEGKEINFSGI